MSMLARLRATFAAGLGLIMSGPKVAARSPWICRVTTDGGKTWRYWG